MKVLVTGGAGYKGAKLSRALLKAGHKVTILDNFMYGFDPILPLVSRRNASIVQKDIRAITKDDLKEYEIIYHLAAISGLLACDANPHSAKVINVDATKQLSKLLDPGQVLVYASTTSFYGKSGKKVDENSKPEPISLYTQTKYDAEKAVMRRKNSVALRFATLFGVSPRMRNDLMVNDFVNRAVNERSLVLFDSDSVRTFLHLDDSVRAYMMILKKPKKMVGDIFNVGSNKMNFSKRKLANRIRKQIDYEIVDSKIPDKDRRDFIINYGKITKLGFKPKKTIDAGILELSKLYSFYHPNLPYRPI